MSKSTIEEALEKQRLMKAAPRKTQDSVKATSETVTESVQDANASLSVDSNTNVDVNNTQEPEDSRLMIPLEVLEDTGYVSVSGKHKLINEEFRGIKRKVLNNAFGPISSTIDSSNLIMVTSASPGEGKSFTAINLALSIALEQDKTVLLVDCDVLKPSLHKKLQVTNDKGIMEFLSGDVEQIQDVMTLTNVDKLRFISAGQKHHLSTELLASHRMAELAREFVNRYPDRVVIMDCPPLLGINETYVLSELAGQILVVVEEGQTKLTHVKNAIGQLNKDKAIGFVMNKSTHDVRSGYGYGYGYGE